MALCDSGQSGFVFLFAYFAGIRNDKGEKYKKLTADIIGNIKTVSESEKKYKDGETEELENGIERTLPKLERHEIICKELFERTNSYRIEKNIWNENFSNSELQEIYNYLSFLKNVMPFELPYDNLLTRDLFMLLSSYERKISYSEETGEFEIEIKCWPDDKAELIEDLKVYSKGFQMEIL